MRNSFTFEYDWVPFTVSGKHYCFVEDRYVRLERGNCNHWGPAIYKWEGKITEGDHAGKIGVLIGETDDIRARLNQYKSGTQEKGNKFWREHFLTKGKIYYWIIYIKNCSLDGCTIEKSQVNSKNFRLVLEQLLVMERLASEEISKLWIVNKML